MSDFIIWPKFKYPFSQWNRLDRKVAKKYHRRRQRWLCIPLEAITPLAVETIFNFKRKLSIYPSFFIAILGRYQKLNPRVFLSTRRDVITRYIGRSPLTSQLSKWESELVPLYRFLSRRNTRVELFPPSRRKICGIGRILDGNNRGHLTPNWVQRGGERERQKWFFSSASSLRSVLDQICELDFRVPLVFFLSYYLRQ